VKKILIIGCGAVGSLFASHLARGGEVEVYAFDVSQPHVDAINKDGLRLSGAADLYTRLAQATTDPAELPRCDYGIVATKAIHTTAAIKAAARCFDDGSAVCSVQNGVGNEELIAEHVRYVIRGTTFPAGHRLHHGAAARFPPTSELFQALIDEGRQVAKAMGIALHGDPLELVAKGANAPGKHKASMLQDVLASRLTEVDFMNGAIVIWGEKYGIPTPLNKAMWTMIKGLEHSWSEP
jgi:ketopantoate reductase